MKTKTISNAPIWETGAHSHEANNLILWVENTRELAGFRDMTFKAIYEGEQIEPLTDIQKAIYFRDLYRMTIKSLNMEQIKAGDSTIKYSNRLEGDFCEVYVSYYENWKEYELPTLNA